MDNFQDGQIGQLSNFQDSPDFLLSTMPNYGNMSEGRNMDWHRPVNNTGHTTTMAADNGQFQMDQFAGLDMISQTPAGYTVTNLNIPQHTPGVQNALPINDPNAQRSRSNSNSGGSEINSDRGTPNGDVLGQGMSFPLPMVSGELTPTSSSLSSVIDGSNLFDPNAAIPGTSQSYMSTAALINAVQHRTPSLVRHLTHSLHAPRRQRSEKKPIPDDQKDDKYFERRRRNNGAAKKSRDNRKAAELEDQHAVEQLRQLHASLVQRKDVAKQRQNELNQIIFSQFV